MAEIPALLSALEVFSQAPDKASIENANAWLQEFQHSVNLSRRAPRPGRHLTGHRIRPALPAGCVGDLQRSPGLSGHAARRPRVRRPDVPHKGRVHSPCAARLHPEVVSFRSHTISSRSLKPICLRFATHSLPLSSATTPGRRTSSSSSPSPSLASRCRCHNGTTPCKP
jgi:hypothetical protein